MLSLLIDSIEVDPLEETSSFVDQRMFTDQVVRHRVHRLRCHCPTVWRGTAIRIREGSVSRHCWRSAGRSCRDRERIDVDEAYPIPRACPSVDLPTPTTTWRSNVSRFPIALQTDHRMEKLPRRVTDLNEFVRESSAFQHLWQCR